MIEMHVVSAARVSSAPVLIGEAGQAGLVWLRSPGSATGDGDLGHFFDAGDTAYLIFITVEEFLLKQSLQNRAWRCDSPLPFRVPQVFGYVDQILSEFCNPSRSICAEAISHSIASSTTSSVSRQSASPS